MDEWPKKICQVLMIQIFHWYTKQFVINNYLKPKHKIYKNDIFQIWKVNTEIFFYVKIFFSIFLLQFPFLIHREQIGFELKPLHKSSYGWWEFSKELIIPIDEYFLTNDKTFIWSFVHFCSCTSQSESCPETGRGLGTRKQSRIIFRITCLVFRAFYVYVFTIILLQYKLFFIIKIRVALKKLAFGEKIKRPFLFLNVLS